MKPPSAARIAIAVGAKLRELRHRRGLSQEQLAHLMESHRPIVGRIERGTHIATMETISRFIVATGGQRAELLEVFAAVDTLL